jgi:uncharacterized protein YukE
MAATTLPTKTLAPLAPFAYDWVGGNIHGLAALAGTLYRYVPQAEAVITALDRKVGEIVGDAGWQGAAASAFTRNWEQISAETTAIGLVIVQTGSIVDQLAVNLSKIENALEQAADKAATHGVQIGSDGQPTQACYASQTQVDWQAGYALFYQRCQAAAEEARVEAAGALHDVYGAMSPGGSGKSSGKRGSSDPEGIDTTVGEGTTISDLLLDLLATPTAYANQIADKVAELRAESDAAVRAYQDARAAAQKAGDGLGKEPADVADELKAVNAELASEESALVEAKAGEGAFSKLFGTRLIDLPGAKAGTSAIDGLYDGDLLEGAFDLPVVDVVAGGIATVINAQEDEKLGIPGYVAYPAEAGASTAAIVAGTMAAGVVGTAVSISAAPEVGIAAGVVTCAVVAYGVGDYLHNLIANYGDQQLAEAATVADTRQLGRDVGHVARLAWDRFTSNLGF